MKTFVSSLLLIIIAASCSTESGQLNNPITTLKETVEVAEDLLSAFIVPVFDTKMETFSLNLSSAQTLLTSSGTRLHIPADAFVIAATGVAVTGDVDVKFDEFHSQGEILSSGIPMVYKTRAGEEVNFESAGMFEIRASKGEEKLALAEGKEIKVELATEVAGAFEFYQFNETSGNWELKDTECLPKKNPYIAEQQTEIDALEENLPPRPKKVVTYKKGDRLFDVKRYGARQEILDQLNGVFWKFTGDSSQIDPSLNPQAFDKEYKFVKLETIKESDVVEYALSFTKNKETIKVRAVPVFQGKLLTRENKRMRKILDKIEEMIDARVRAEKAMAREKSVLRTFNVDELAIYNYDRQMKDPEAVPFFAIITIDGSEPSDGLTVYLLPAEKAAVIRYPGPSYSNFRINPSENNRLVAITSDDQVYALSSKELQQMKLGNYSEGAKVKFDLKFRGSGLKTSEELDELIAQL
jgi:hypothetical protein